MKKSLSAVLVIMLSLIGADALAAKVDGNVNNTATQTQDKTGGWNGDDGPIKASK
jgi:uncharacterized protein YdeI (BOF family)